MQLPGKLVFTPGKWADTTLPQSCYRCHNVELTMAGPSVSGDALEPPSHSFCFVPWRLLPSVIFPRGQGKWEIGVLDKLTLLILEWEEPPSK